MRSWPGAGPRRHLVLVLVLVVLVLVVVVARPGHPGPPIVAIPLLRGAVGNIGREISRQRRFLGAKKNSRFGAISGQQARQGTGDGAVLQGARGARSLVQGRARWKRTLNVACMKRSKLPGMAG